MVKRQYFVKARRQREQMADISNCSGVLDYDANGDLVCPKCGHRVVVKQPPPKQAAPVMHAEQVIGLLLAAGYVNPERLIEARSIALGLQAEPLTPATSADPPPSIEP